MIRDYSATAHVHGARKLIRNWEIMDPLVSRAWDAAVQSTLPARRFGPLAHAWLIGFGDVA